MLVNNAGFGSYGPFAEADPDREADEVAVDALIAAMAAHPDHQDDLRRLVIAVLDRLGRFFTEGTFDEQIMAANLIGFAPSTLRTWRCTRSDGPPYLKDGTRVRYDFHELLSWKERTFQHKQGGKR